MGLRVPMELSLDFLTHEELLRFFHRKKTEISCIDQPHTFLRQLRDHDLVSEKLYQRVVRMKTKEQKMKGVYEVLDSLETDQAERVKTFWECVFTDHILQHYPTLKLLRNSLMDGSFRVNESQPEMNRLDKRKNTEGKNKDIKEKKVKKMSRQKRKGSSTSGREEEEEEEDQAGTSKVTTSQKKKKKKLQKPNYCSPLRKGGREDIWNWPMHRSQLPVTCGDKEGFLHRDKLAKGDKCILHEDQWYTPGEFEKLGGKERNKNWKYSIRCRQTTLQKLIQENHLKSPPAKRRTTEKGQMRRALFPSSPENSIILSDSSEEESHSRIQEEDREGDEEEEEGDRGEEEGRMAEDRDDSSYHGNRDVDTSMFEGSTLPVQCGSVVGILQKDRFASRTTGKCIRTEESWLTPTEFIRLNPDLRDGLWKRDITCRGQPLAYLLQRKILQVHSLLCLCPMCSHAESDLD
ncbi:nuclear body protein SP140-like protein [Clupea harengus]|uniref:Nuclear body protein SP140-like protein n=1 Tax=Clupea harengus TaxID=7950 RepID=A0A6P8EXI7_CLUHA|nr:nuclear body protein SP140-like protein [Clupea harengus]XP_042559278.1 nuclear body protein SP140-like protein [Clupea harengus]